MQQHTNLWTHANRVQNMHMCILQADYEHVRTCSIGNRTPQKMHLQYEMIRHWMTEGSFFKFTYWDIIALIVDKWFGKQFIIEWESIFFIAGNISLRYSHSLCKTLRNYLEMLKNFVAVLIFEWILRENWQIFTQNFEERFCFARLHCFSLICVWICTGCFAHLCK